MTLVEQQVGEQAPQQQVKRTPMGPNDTYALDLGTPIKEDEFGLAKRVYPSGSLVAVIEAADKRFGLVDIRSNRELTNPPADFLLIDDSFDMRAAKEGSSKGFKAIRQSREPVTIGRGHLTKRFEYSEHVSADHFEIDYHDNALRIKNLEPTNATALQTATPPHLEADAIGGRTFIASERARETGFYGQPTKSAPYGTYLNHPIIGKNSPTVENGVYMGGSSREAIVVDGESETLQKSFQGLLEKIHYAKPPDLISVLKIIKMHVQQEMPYDGPKTEQISSKYKGDMLVGLSQYINQKAGVCRHQALFASYLTNRLIQEGILYGESHVQRNNVPDFGGAHGWATFVAPDGTEYVIDPAQNFEGTKEEARRQTGKWQYYVPLEEQPMRLP
jgi:hypothetical protein